MENIVIIGDENQINRDALTGGLITGKIRWNEAVGLPVRQWRRRLGRPDYGAGFDIKAWERVPRVGWMQGIGEQKEHFWKPLAGDVAFEEALVVNGQWVLGYSIAGIDYGSVVLVEVDLRYGHTWYTAAGEGYRLMSKSMSQASGPREVRITPEKRVVAIDWEMVDIKTDA